METTLIEQIGKKTNAALEEMLKKYSTARVEIHFFHLSRCIGIKILCYNTEDLYPDHSFECYNLSDDNIDIKAIKKILRSDILSLGKENKYTSKLVWLRNLLVHEPYWLILEKT